ncbi:hypothetical protein HK405_004719 [Cladochytrium tenue]|nr:hypothetical protein HK405_004719 [Cladochytrium tenue]
MYYIMLASPGRQVTVVEATNALRRTWEADARSSSPRYVWVYRRRAAEVAATQLQQQELQSLQQQQHQQHQDLLAQQQQEHGQGQQNQQQQRMLQKQQPDMQLQQHQGQRQLQHEQQYELQKKQYPEGHPQQHFNIELHHKQPQIWQPYHQQQHKTSSPYGSVLSLEGFQVTSSPAAASPSPQPGVISSVTPVDSSPLRMMTPSAVATAVPTVNRWSTQSPAAFQPIAPKSPVPRISAMPAATTTASHKRRASGANEEAFTTRPPQQQQEQQQEGQQPNRRPGAARPRKRARRSVDAKQQQQQEQQPGGPPRRLFRALSFHDFQEFLARKHAPPPARLLTDARAAPAAVGPPVRRTYRRRAAVNTMARQPPLPPPSPTPTQGGPRSLRPPPVSASSGESGGLGGSGHAGRQQHDHDDEGQQHGNEAGGASRTIEVSGVPADADAAADATGRDAGTLCELDRLLMSICASIDADSAPPPPLAAHQSPLCYNDDAEAPAVSAHHDNDDGDGIGGGGGREDDTHTVTTPAPPPPLPPQAASPGLAGWLEALAGAGDANPAVSSSISSSSDWAMQPSTKPPSPLQTVGGWDLRPQPRL